MVIKIAEYTIKPGELDAALAAIEKFVEAIKESEPATFYEAFCKNDTLEFVHVMKFADADAEQRHKEAAYTVDFVNVLYPRCAIEPRFTDVTQVK